MDARETAADLERYRRLIQRLASERQNVRVANGLPEHAAILLETMFDTAKSDMRIYTGSLDRSVYGSSGLCAAARRFVAQPGARLRVLLQTKPEAKMIGQHPFLEQFLENASLCENVEVRYAKEGTVYAGDQAKHFAVMDDCAFRFETDHKQTQAFANFNEPATASRLIDVFDQVFTVGAERVGAELRA